MVDKTWEPGKILLQSHQLWRASEDYIALSSACRLNIIDVFNNRHDYFYEKFPYSSIYDMLPEKIDDEFRIYSKPGEVRLFGKGTEKEKYIYNMFVQEFTKEPAVDYDSYEKRAQFFESCLTKVYETKGIKSLAMEDLVVPTRMQDKFIQIYYPIMQKYAQKYPQVRTVVYIKYFVDYLEKVLNKPIIRK